MGLIMTAIIGGLIGWLASIAMKTNAQMGMIANIVVGIVGANVGAWLAGLVGFVPRGGIAAVIVAVIGASVLIGILKLLNVFK
jgi:uncharacterized membrane protein YeaQ/YmgE (transglycosylase-associated protein family)